jgi:hypothetical protein
LIRSSKQRSALVNTVSQKPNVFTAVLDLSPAISAYRTFLTMSAPSSWLPKIPTFT